MFLFFLFFSFFFQAEDGIRDGHVTGVQTCALPIFNAMRLAHAFCQSVVDARVLVVCAELCTLHFKVDDTLERAVVNSLFAVGAAAVVFAARPEAEARGRLSYAGSQTLLYDYSIIDLSCN